MRPVRAEARGVGLVPYLRFRVHLAYACVCKPEAATTNCGPHGSDLHQMVQLICFFLHIPLNLFEIESKQIQAELLCLLALNLHESRK